MTLDSKTQECPYCKEEIRSDAIRCKHCRSAIAPKKAPHGGTCPFCKEAIHPEAVKCKHCGSNVAASNNDAPCDDCSKADRSEWPRIANRVVTPPSAQGGVWEAQPSMARARSGCSPCAPGPGTVVWGLNNVTGAIESFGGTRVCWASVPVLRRDGTIGYIEVSWTEDCSSRWQQVID